MSALHILQSRKHVDSEAPKALKHRLQVMIVDRSFMICRNGATQGISLDIQRSQDMDCCQGNVAEEAPAQKVQSKFAESLGYRATLFVDIKNSGHVVQTDLYVMVLSNWQERTEYSVDCQKL